MHVAHITTGTGIKEDQVKLIIPEFDDVPRLKAIEINPEDFETLRQSARIDANDHRASFFGVQIRPNIRVRRGDHELVYF